MALVNDLDDLEPRLTRHGYNVKALSEMLNVRPREIRSFLHGQRPPSRTQALQQEMLAVGIPLEYRSDNTEQIVEEGMNMTSSLNAYVYLN